VARRVAEGGSFDAMDEWLTAIEADTSDAPILEKIIANKPDRAVDSCFIGGQQRTDKTECDAAYPYYGAPRIAAGGPTAHDNLKCELAPIDREADYGPVGLSDAEFERLEAVFPDGVCDFSKPAVDRTPSQPWLSFAAGPGGQPLGAAPVSTPSGPAVLVPEVPFSVALPIAGLLLGAAAYGWRRRAVA